jgi:hypothetical protein
LANAANPTILETVARLLVVPIVARIDGTNAPLRFALAGRNVVGSSETQERRKILVDDEKKMVLQRW